MRRRTQLFVVALVGVVAVLYAHCQRYWPFISDDALISLRYAQRLAEGHGLSWSGTDRVEGYSDLLWVLLLAPAHGVGLDLIWTARVVDFVGAVAAICVVSLSVDTLRPSPVRLVTGGVVLATSAPVAVWAIGGLEHGFMLGLLAGALLLVTRELDAEATDRRSLWIASALLGALCLLRLDGAVLCLGVGLGAAIALGPKRHTLAVVGQLATVPTALVALQSLFRRAYHGSWYPHTASVKVTVSELRLKEGFEYVRGGLEPLAVVLLVALAAAVLLGRRGQWRTRLALPVTLIVVWVGYVAVVGGDIFPGWRQLLFVLVPLAALIADGAQQLGREIDRKTRWAVLLVLPVAGLSFVRQDKNPANVRAKKEVWEWDGQSIGDLLQRAFGAQQPLLAVDAAGALPYWSALPCVDMLGLNDPHLVHRPPPGFGVLEIGHGLGNGEYVLERNPDLLVFCNSSGHVKPCFPGGRQLMKIPRFHETFQLVVARGQIGNRALANLYFNREQGMLGVQRSPDRIVIPGYFFASLDTRLEATLNEQDRLVLRVTDQAPGVLPALEVPAGTWRIQAKGAAAAEAKIGVRCPHVSAVARAEAREVSMRLERPTPLRIAVAPPDGGAVELESVTLDRVVDMPTHGCPPAGMLRTNHRGLGDAKPENTFWAHPTNLVLPPAGVLVDLEATRYLRSIELSTDNDDAYDVTLLAEGMPVHRFTLEPKRNGGGLTVRSTELPPNVTIGGVDQVRIEPRGGDGSYAVGHLALRERRGPSRFDLDRPPPPRSPDR